MACKLSLALFLFLAVTFISINDVQSEKRMVRRRKTTPPPQGQEVPQAQETQQVQESPQAQEEPEPIAQQEEDVSDPEQKGMSSPFFVGVNGKNKKQSTNRRQPPPKGRKPAPPPKSAPQRRPPARQPPPQQPPPQSAPEPEPQPPPPQAEIQPSPQSELLPEEETKQEPKKRIVRRRKAVVPQQSPQGPVGPTSSEAKSEEEFKQEAETSHILTAEDSATEGPQAGTGQSEMGIVDSSEVSQGPPTAGMNDQVGKKETDSNCKCPEPQIVYVNKCDAQQPTMTESEDGNVKTYSHSTANGQQSMMTMGQTNNGPTQMQSSGPSMQQQQSMSQQAPQPRPRRQPPQKKSPPPPKAPAAGGQPQQSPAAGGQPQQSPAAAQQAQPQPANAQPPQTPAAANGQPQPAPANGGEPQPAASSPQQPASPPSGQPTIKAGPKRSKALNKGEAEKGSKMAPEEGQSAEVPTTEPEMSEEGITTEGAAEVPTTAKPSAKKALVTGEGEEQKMSPEEIVVEMTTPAEEAAPEAGAEEPAAEATEISVEVIKATTGAPKAKAKAAPKKLTKLNNENAAKLAPEEPMAEEITTPPAVEEVEQMTEGVEEAAMEVTTPALTTLAPKAKGGKGKSMQKSFAALTAGEFAPFEPEPVTPAAGGEEPPPPPPEEAPAAPTKKPGKPRPGKREAHIFRFLSF